MVTPITITCPHCQTVCDILLSTTPRIIIFNCPSCRTPQIYFEKRSFVLTDQQIEVFKNSNGQSSINHLISSIVHHRKQHGQYTDPCLEVESRSRKLVGASLSRNRNRTITSDDITNLRIELETSRDSGHFIEQI